MNRPGLTLIFFILLPFCQSLTAQENEGLTYAATFRSELIAPVKIEKTGAGSYFIDFGKDAFGTLLLQVQVSSRATLTIHLGEKLSDINRIDRNPGGTIRYQKLELEVIPGNVEYLLKLPADKRNTNPPAVQLPDSFGVVTPFRYCEIENSDTELKPDNIFQKVYYYSFNDESSLFTSSDTTLNRIWDLCKYSIKATSFCGLYIDGDRERIPYEADALINQLSHYAVDDEYTLARRTNEYFMSHPTWPTEWILHTIIIFYYDYLYSGDKTLVEKYYDALKTKTLIDLEREDGLISVKSPKHNEELIRKLGFSDPKQRLRDIVDWPPAQKDTGWKLATNEGERDGYEMVDYNTVVNSFHFYSLKLMSEIAGWLGKQSDSEYFSNKAKTVGETINKKLFDNEKGIYVDGEGSLHSSLHANMFPLAFGIVPEKYRQSVVDFIKTRGMACSVYGAQHLLDGLYDAGEAGYAFSLLTSTSDRSWWNMIRTGSTITLEAWDMKYKPNSDWNHAWGAAPANIIARQMWGIKPVEPGFKKAIIKPQLGQLTKSHISLPTIKGNINAVFIRCDDCLEKFESFAIDIPDGMSVRFIFPTRKFRKIILDKNKQIGNSKGFIDLEPGLHDIKFIVGR